MEITKKRGFTLIEVILGLLVMSIAVTGITSILFSYTTSVANPVFEVKASFLGQRIFREIMSKSYDENSDRLGGQCRCDEIIISGNLNICAIGSCTSESSYGPDDTEKGASFSNALNDVDDYDSAKLCASTTSGIGCKKFENNDVCGDKTSCYGIPAEFFTGSFASWKDVVSGTESDIGYKDFYVVIDLKPLKLSRETLKRITVRIIDPQGSTYRLDSLRGNY